MKTLVQFSIYSLLLLSSIHAFAQPRGGGRGGRPGGGPEEMIAREKQTVFTKINDLSEDQKMLLEGIYEEFGVTLKETFEEMRGSDDREKRQETMQNLRAEKDLLIKDVLNEEQYTIYQEISTSRRERKRQPENEDPS